MIGLLWKVQMEGPIRERLLCDGRRWRRQRRAKRRAKWRGWYWQPVTNLVFMNHLAYGHPQDAARMATDKLLEEGFDSPPEEWTPEVRQAMRHEADKIIQGKETPNV